MLTPLSRYIKEQRIALGKTQKELAEESGISLMTMRRAENGETLSLETLVSLLEVFGELEAFKSFFIIGDREPRDLIRKSKTPRKRVRKNKRQKNKPQEWVWGDDLE